MRDDGSVTCPACSHDNREGARFCESCGHGLVIAPACPACGAIGREGARFCDACGSAMEAAEPATPPGPDLRDYTPDHLAAKLRSAGDSASGERKQVTVMFADVTGSMDLAERTGPETWRSILDRFFALLCEGVHRFEGTVIQFTGDGLMALFGAPIAHEDHAPRAAYAALHLQRTLREYADDLRREQGVSFSVRIGLNSGEVVVGGIGEDLRVDYTAIGHTVGLAQRMEALAEPGRAYVTEHTAALLEGYFELRDLGRFAVKGVSAPLGVYELIRTGAVRTRLDRSRAVGYSRFVGRDRELVALEDALERALAGDGSVVALVGEAGVGKSRLCDEFVQRCRARDLDIYTAAGAAHTRNVPFHAALEMLRGYFGVSDRDDPQVARERIAGRMLLLDPALGADLPLVFDFVGVPDRERPAPRMDPDARRRRLAGLVDALVAAQSARRPAVNLLEDLHWIDGASEALLEALVEAVPGRRALLVVNHRPEYRAEWLALPHVTRVPVVALGRAAVDELLSDLVGDDPGVAAVRRQVRERTGGNPFFVEEVIRALREDGTLVGERGALRLAGAPGTVTVPATVHSVLAARIDRLAPGDKALLQAAAVVGVEFDSEVLRRAAAELEPIGPALRRLVAADLIAERAIYPEIEYAFRHPLVQEVAYRSQLTERRKTLHAAVARTIAEQSPEFLDERAALLAGHWEAAGETAEAVRWHARAAAWAGLNDPGHALEHWRKVLDLASTLPESAETVALGVTSRLWILQFGWRLGMSREEREAIFAEGRALAERAADDATLALLLGGYGGLVGTSGDGREALRLVEEADRLARRSGNAHVDMALSPFLAYLQALTGDFRAAGKTVDRAIALGDAAPELGSGIALRSPYAWVVFFRGYVDAVTGNLARARQAFSRALELAEHHGDVETLGWTLGTTSWLAQWAGDREGVLEQVVRAVEVADGLGSAFSRVWAHTWMGAASLEFGDLATAASEFDLALELIAAHRTGLEAEPWIRAYRARVRCASGDIEDALADCREASRQSDVRGVVSATATIHTAHAQAFRLARDLGRAREEAVAAVDAAARLGALSEQGLALWELGEIEWASDDPDSAERCMREALEIFERVGADGHVARLAQRLAVA